jgi:FkbM family methyltransferase
MQHSVVFVTITSVVAVFGLSIFFVLDARSERDRMLSHVFAHCRPSAGQEQLQPLPLATPAPPKPTVAPSDVLPSSLPVLPTPCPTPGPKPHPNNDLLQICSSLISKSHPPPSDIIFDTHFARFYGESCTIVNKRNSYAHQLTRVVVGRFAFLLLDRIDGPTVGDWLLRQEAPVMALFHFVLSAAAHTHTPVVVDVGANIGFYSLLSIAAGARVLAFDIQPVCISDIMRGIRINGFDDGLVAAQRVAVCAKRGVLYFPEGKYCNGKIAVAADGEERQGLTAVECETLPTLLSRFDFGLIDLVKMDIEGAEAIALPAAEMLFAARRVRNLIVEVTPKFWREKKWAVDPLARFFKRVLALGYEGVVVDSVYNPHRDWTTLSEEGVEKWFQNPTTLQEDWWFFWREDHASVDANFLEKLMGANISRFS